MNGKLPLVKNAEISGKGIVVRVDLDLPACLAGGPAGRQVCPRQEATENIVKFLKEKNAGKVKAIGHRGEYMVVNDLRRKYPEVEWSDNLRDDPREKENSEEYAIQLAGDFEVYVNEAFAVSHRQHASVDALPRWMRKNGRQAYLGLRFEKEIDKLNQVWSHPGWKILVIGGAKAADKAEYAIKLSGRLDRVLVGGVLPLQITNDKSFIPSNITLGTLREDEKDLTDESIEVFLEQIKVAQTIICAGPMGRFEETEGEKGTKEIFTAVANSLAYRIAGGGSTEDALAKYGLMEKFDWISVGGGAMLEYLATGTLPGIEAITV